jgi:RNA polymerase sigma factor (sigma-70 family)
LPTADRKNFVAEIAAQYGRRLRRFLSVRLRNVQDVPELAQEVFLRLLRVERHEAIRNPEAYLFTVASHVIHQHALRRAASPAFVDIAEAASELTVSDGDDPVTKTDNAQRIEHLEAFLAKLPPRVAAALVLHRVSGFTVQEVADQLGVRRETAKRYLARAAQYCRDRRVGSGIDSAGGAAKEMEHY